MPSSEANILVVDDSRLDRALIEAYLSNAPYALDFAEDGVEAMGRLETQPGRYDVVLLDRTMPRMDGLTVLVSIKKDPRLRMLPVIMQTALASPKDVMEGIRAGAYYYLTKPYDSETLLAMIETATRDFSEYRELQQKVRRGVECLTLMQSATLLIRTVEQARATAAVFVNACPDPERVVIGLTELLVNAVEHGALGISYDDKTELNASGQWEAEVTRRLALPENADKRVKLVVERGEGELRFTISDPGPGFDWEKYLEVQPQRAFDNHGRGIAIARAVCFDRIEYRGCGNEVVAVVKL